MTSSSPLRPPNQAGQDQAQSVGDKGRARQGIGLNRATVRLEAREGRGELGRERGGCTCRWRCPAAPARTIAHARASANGVETAVSQHTGGRARQAMQGAAGDMVWSAIRSAPDYRTSQAIDIVDIPWWCSTLELRTACRPLGVGCAASGQVRHVALAAQAWVSTTPTHRFGGARHAIA